MVTWSFNIVVGKTSLRHKKDPETIHSSFRYYKLVTQITDNIPEILKHFELSNKLFWLSG